MSTASIKKGNFLFVFSLAFSTHLLAAEVLDDDLNTFVGGEAAIAADVNHNFTVLKDAVNDNNTSLGNKQDKIFQACSTGQAIRQINEDGTVSCSSVVVSGGSGDITAVNAGTGLSGGATTGDATLSVDTTTIQKRVSGACLAGEYIRAVNEDGSVLCETSGSSAPVTSADIVDNTIVDADISDATTLTATDFNYTSPKTRYYTVNINDFVPYTDTYTYTRNDNQLNPSSTGNVFFFAPVHLPNNAIIKSIDFYTTDNSTTSYINWYFRERILATGASQTTIANVSGDSAAAPGDENLSVTGLNHTVDLSQYYYQIRIQFTDGSTQLYFHGARITYEMGSPD